jgi:hypothetical protein
MRMILALVHFDCIPEMIVARLNLYSSRGTCWEDLSVEGAVTASFAPVCQHVLAPIQLTSPKTDDIRLEILLVALLKDRIQLMLHPAVSETLQQEQTFWY